MALCPLFAHARALRLAGAAGSTGAPGGVCHNRENSTPYFASAASSTSASAGAVPSQPPRTPPAHPTYEVMVKAAIVSLKDRSGSSTQAIAKYLAATYKLPDGWKKVLSTQVKKMAASAKLLKVKNSFKLGEALIKAPKKVVKKKPPKQVVKKKPKVSTLSPKPLYPKPRAPNPTKSYKTPICPKY